MNEGPPEHQGALTRPCYKRDGEVEVGFAGHKNFVGLYMLRRDVMHSHRSH